MKGKRRSGSVAVRQFLNTHAHIRLCLMADLLNLSSVAREVMRQDENEGLTFDAVLVSLRRYQLQRKNQRVSEHEIKRAFSTAKVRVRTKIYLVIISKPRSFGVIGDLQQEIKHDGGEWSIIEGESSYTIVTDEQFASKLKGTLKSYFLSAFNDVAQVTLIFPSGIEMTRGVLAQLHTVLFQEGINILEEMSCWTDIMMIIERKDLASMLKVLEELTAK
jgi:aspartokinase